nr:hypothetical protein Itr_chr10CG20310 [Ipomoea trifida]
MVYEITTHTNEHKLTNCVDRITTLHKRSTVHEVIARTDEPNLSVYVNGITALHKKGPTVHKITVSMDGCKLAICADRFTTLRKQPTG